MRGSVRGERQQLWNDLDDFVRAGVESGDFAVIGRALQRRFAPPLDGGGTTPGAAQAAYINFKVYNQTNQIINLSLTQPNNNVGYYNATIYTRTPINGSFLANPTPSVTATATASGYNAAFAPVPLGTQSIVVAVSTTNPSQLTITTYT